MKRSSRSLFTSATRSCHQRSYPLSSSCLYSSNVVITNPATDVQKTLDIQFDTAESVARKFKLASEAQAKWSLTPLSHRKQIITEFSKQFLSDSNIQTASKLLTEDMGKPISQSINEIKGSQSRIQFFIDNFESAINIDKVKSNGNPTEEISREPLGVIANISAWNYPYFVGLNVLLPAILTGNAVLYKPSEFVLQTGAHIVQLLHQAGVPKDLVIPVYGRGDVGNLILQQPIDGVFFTGSVPTGQKINQSVASKVIRVQLELGGKDPTYVSEDLMSGPDGAEMVARAAASLADGAMYNAGQSCCSVERLYVHTRVHDAFVEELKKEVQKMKVGDPLDTSTYIGPLARKQQVDVLRDQIKDAIGKGAKILVGSTNPPRGVRSGSYFEPTVLVDVHHDMKVMREESFGPIVGVQKVGSEMEAVKLMNDTEYGLTAGVYSRSEETAKRVLSQVKAGSVYWNCCDRVSPNLPWSGRRMSGLGLTLSKEGITAFTVPKAWHLKAST